MKDIYKNMGINKVLALFVIVVCLIGCETTKPETVGTIIRRPIPPVQGSYYVCFERDFYTEEDAEFWALEVKNSFNNLPDQFLLQDNSGNRRKFIVGLGPFHNRAVSESRLTHISGMMNVPMYVVDVK